MARSSQLSDNPVICWQKPPPLRFNDAAQLPLTFIRSFDELNFEQLEVNFIKKPAPW
jgi:hypothetical protein